MAIPTKTDLEGMDFTLWGEPFIETVADINIDLTGLDYTLWGEPFVRNPGGAIIYNAIFFGTGF